MRNNTYTFVFMTIVCVVCSVSLALAAMLLQPKQDFNVQMEMKKNVLKVLGLFGEEQKSASSQELLKLYNDKIMKQNLDAAGNEAADGSLQVFIRRDNGTIAIPIEGMGLWSLLKGYFAVQKDGHTVAGITFYEQKETPGLGAEIDQKWFTDNYKGKSILNKKGELVSVKVAKGKVSEQPADVQQNMVDGISGATMTTRGVNDLLLAGLKSYRPYFEKIWAQSGPTN